MNHRQTTPFMALGLFLVFSLALIGCVSPTPTPTAGDAQQAAAEPLRIAALIPEQIAFLETLAGYGL